MNTTEATETKPVEEIDLNRENYFDNPDVCPWGSIIKFKTDPSDSILDLKKQSFATGVFKEGDVAFVVRSFQNKQDQSLVFLFVLDQEKFVMYTRNWVDEIEVVRKGTTKKKILGETP